MVEGENAGVRLKGAPTVTLESDVPDTVTSAYGLLAAAEAGAAAVVAAKVGNSHRQQTDLRHSSACTCQPATH